MLEQRETTFYRHMATKRVKDKVVSFRLTEEHYAAFVEKLAAEPIIGAGSPGRMARKMAMDFITDALVWKSKKRRLLTYEVYMATQPASAPAP